MSRVCRVTVADSQWLLIPAQYVLLRMENNNYSDKISKPTPFQSPFILVLHKIFQTKYSNCFINILVYAVNKTHQSGITATSHYLA